MAHRRKQQAPSWNAPKQFDEYRLLWQLGRGGMGEVYLGHDTLLDRPVAIKFISAIEPDALMREQFLTEARAAARLQHPNVVTIYRVGEIEGRPYIISEFVRGQNLDHVKLPMPWSRALEMAIGLTRGLAAAHRRGVLHRDIKPGNVILATDGEVKLLDFGLAKFIEAGVMQDLLTEGPQLQRLDMTAPTIDIKAGISTEQPALNLKETPPMPPGAPMGNADELATTAPRVSVQFGALNGGKPSARSGPPQFVGNQAVGILEHDSDGDLRRTSGIKGTPLYMAPEVLNGEPASRRSDIYSLGALLYELCVGSPPHYDPLASLEDLRAAANNKDAPPMSGLVANIEPRFAAVVERCLRRKPSERYSSGEELRDALEQLADTAKKDDIPAGNPYRGLLPFEAEHRSLFFGRKSEIGTLVDRLRTEPFIIVAADSGVGKSSLCRAGVLPLVEEGALGAGRTYRAVTLVPGRRPLASLAAALARVLTIDEEQLLEDLRKEPTQLARILNRNVGADGGLLIFIDQMEELVTIGEQQEVTLVGEALGALAGRSGNVRLLATVRSDFLARLAAVPEIGDEVSRALYILRPLSPEKIREVIVGPAHKKGVSFESETLVNKIVATTASADGGLPLLQFALAELWEVKSGDVITAHALESIGGVEGALARHADHVIGRLPAEQRVSARRILMNLVTLEGTRARRVEEELVRDGAPARGALEALVRGRLLVARDTPEGAAYEVAHEALIRGWDTLRKWLEEHAESRAVKQRLETAVVDWFRLGRSKDVLWGGRQIAETALLEANDIGPKEAEFLAASRSQAARSRRWRQFVLASLPVLIIGLYGAVRILAARDLEKRVGAAMAEGQKLMSDGKEKAKEAEKLRQQAFVLFDQMKREPGEEIWSQALKQAQASDRDLGDSAGKLEAALTLDASRKDVRAMLADALYARALGAEVDHAEILLRDLMQRLPLYDQGGARMKQWAAPGHVAISTDPPGAQILVEQYVEDEHGKRQLRGRKELGSTPLVELTFEVGSYLMTVRPPVGYQAVKYPFIVGRGESLTLDFPLPPANAVPKGFSYIPAGRFLFGVVGQEALRKKFFSAAPAHQVNLPSYLIAIHETTYAEYIEFLESLPVDKRTSSLPMAGSQGIVGRTELKPAPPNRWQLSIQPGSVALSAMNGEPIVYAARRQNAKQDWLHFPVAGISRVEAEAYTAWLSKSGKVPGARLCTELEWERAARGADDREFPTGNQIRPSDANFDETHNRKPEAWGPDEVGLHPESRSPFGVDDLVGNAWEMMSSSLEPDGTVTRSGGYGHDSLTCNSVNRNPVDTGWRSADLGLRVCAPVRLGSSNPG